MHPLINIAIRAARRAGDIINQALPRLDRLVISEKGVNDFVTDIDQKAEMAIIDTIRQVYPNHGIIAEESGEQKGKECTWIIDPLDGTTNFMHGFPHFSVSIAVRCKDVLEHAVIYDPNRSELFTASRGSGAQLNNRRIRVSPKKPFSQALLGTGFPFKNKALLTEYLAHFEKLFEQCAGIRRCGSAALDLAYVAAGRLDGFWEYGLKPWDIAAGTLLVKEAGGLVSDFNGGETYLTTGNIVAASPKLLKGLIQELAVSK